MTLPKLNSIIECRWMDVVGDINGTLSTIKPQGCVTIGRLARIESDYIVITSSVYESDDDDPVLSLIHI